MGVDEFIGLYIELPNHKKRGINSRRAFEFAHGWAVQHLTKEDWANLKKYIAIRACPTSPQLRQSLQRPDRERVG